jgi:hypothetical protein
MKPLKLWYLSLAIAAGQATTMQAAEVSFDNEVMAVLSRTGCNRGGCHGNANGKGGFRLSLRGQDPDFDYHWMVRQTPGRRLNRLEPEKSLLLLKPTGRIAHQGGVLFREDSSEYHILHDWIASGVPREVPRKRRLTGLEVEPAVQYLYEPDDYVALHAVATFDDGTTADITQLATYELSNLVAEVSSAGVVERRSFGETTVMVRYLQLQFPVRLAFVPPRNPDDWNPDDGQSPPVNNYIDRLIDEKLRLLHITPSPVADDVTFVRRVYQDAIGLPPLSEEAKRFAFDQRPDKRARLIDELLERPEFAELWGLKWCDILRVEEKVLDSSGVDVFHRWLVERMADGTPLDQLVRQLLRADGSTYENPPANFWRANRDPPTRAETTARLFLGARLQCAKCHNHPFDRWSQDDYYSWAALFARIDYEIVENERRDRLDNNEFKGEQRVTHDFAGQVIDPRTGQAAQPKLLGAARLGPSSYHDRLTPLAAWLASADNTRFAKAQANFVWYHVMGRGLVEPIDDFRDTNPPSNPKLLRALADDLVKGGFDLRHLVRRVMNSRTYQLSSVPNGTNQADEANFSRAIIFRLPAERLLDAQSAVLGLPAEFAGYPTGLRAGQIPGVRKVRRRDSSPAAGDRFLRMFGKPERLLACECERSNETTMSQAFLLIGGDIHGRLANPTNALARLDVLFPNHDDVVEALYWRTLSRPPTSDERGAARELLSSTPTTDLRPFEIQWSRLLAYLNLRDPLDDRFARIQDLAWGLLNSKEFILRH